MSVFPVRRLVGLVGAALRDDPTPLSWPDAYDSRVAKRLLGLRRRIAGLSVGMTTADGFEIPYLTGGTHNAGRDIVLIHGFADTKDTFVEIARSLTRTHRVFLLDVPGFSEASQPWDFHYSVPAMAAIVASALRRLGVHKPHMVGNSMGGAIALQYALTHPDSTRTLTLIGAAGVPMPEPSVLEQRLRAGDNPFVLQTYEEWWDYLTMVLHKMPYIPRVVRRHMARVFIGRAALNEKIFADMLEDELDFSERLSEVRAPTLALWGDRDRVIDVSAGRSFKAGIAGAELVILPGIGHAPQVEAPRATAKLVGAHIRAHAGT